MPGTSFTRKSDIYQGHKDEVNITFKDKENPSLVFSGDREIPTRGSTVPVGKRGFAEFPTGTVDPRVGISRFHCTPMIDSISHISNKE